MTVTTLEVVQCDICHEQYIVNWTEIFIEYIIIPPKHVCSACMPGFMEALTLLNIEFIRFTPPCNAPKNNETFKHGRMTLPAPPQWGVNLMSYFKG